MTGPTPADSKHTAPALNPVPCSVNRPSPSLLADLGVFATAWLVRFGWMARWGTLHSAVDTSDLRSVRRVFDGHERLLIDAFTGSPPTPSPQAWPAAIALHQGLGLLTQDPRAPLLLATLLGALAAALVCRGMRRQTDLQGGLLAGLLVALLPEHVAWSTSAIPIVHGSTALVAAAVVQPRWARAALTMVAAVCRPELAVPALLVGLPGLAAWPVAAAQLALFGSPPANALLPALEVNLPLLGMLGPAVLVLTLLGIRNRRAGALAALALLTHLVGSTFADYGPRHVLVGGMALCALGAWLPQRRWMAGLLLAALLFETHSLSTTWHTRPLAPTHATAVSADGCVEISDEPPVPGQPRPSWVQWVAGELDAPCAIWIEAPEHGEWSSRGLRARAFRMHHRWELQPVSTDAPGHGRPWKQTWRLMGGPGVARSASSQE